MTASRAIVFDSNADALMRRHAALLLVAPESEVLATQSRTATLLLCADAPAGTPVLIDLCVTDRLSLDLPGERLIQRLARNPATSHVRPIAWSAHVGPEVVEGVRRAGGAGFVTATLRQEREAGELARVLDGEAVWPASAIGEDWEAWFASTYRVAWQPWMEPILVRLAASAERRSVASELVAVGAARSTNHAAARMREVSRALAGEHSGSAPTVAQRANLVLSQLAARRELSERPQQLSSLEQGADLLRRSPSLAVAAALGSDEVDDLLALDTLIREQRAIENPGAGAPPSDRVREERRWAAGRRALELGANVEDVDDLIAGILIRVQGALVALDDARDDERAHAGPRAAAALVALASAPSTEAADVAVAADGTLTWRGHTPAQLMLDDDVDEAALREFTLAVDAALAVDGRVAA